MIYTWLVGQWRDVDENRPYDDGADHGSDAWRLLAMEISRISGANDGRG